MGNAAFLDPDMFPKKCQKLGHHAAAFKGVDNMPPQDVGLGIMLQPIPHANDVDMVKSYKKRGRAYDDDDCFYCLQK